MQRLWNARSIALAMAVAAVSSTSFAANVQFTGTNSPSWHDGGNWFDGNVPSNGGDFYFVQHDLTAAYTTGTSSVAKLTVSDDSAGSFTMNAGHLTITAGGDSFVVGRGLNADPLSPGGYVSLSGTAILEIGGSDPIVGQRDKGVMDVGGNAQVIPTTVGGVYWRLGNYGPTTDDGLEGDGLLNVHNNASFAANVIFIADNDATGELRVADHGSVALTGNLVPRPSGFKAAGSATVRMTGSNATLSAFNLESASEVGEIATKYRFDADGSGVSELTLVDAINITNNDLEVNLNGFSMPYLSTLLLFDGDQALAGNRVFGTFANYTVDGNLNPSNYTVLYDQVNGDILLQAVPEPTSALALAGAAGLLIRRRRSAV